MDIANDQKQLIEGIMEHYGEHFEHVGDGAPLLMIDILSKMVISERGHIEYLERRLHARDH